MTPANNNSKKRWRPITAIALLLLAASFLALKAANGSFPGLWKTPDQQGQDLMNHGDYDEAAVKFQDPMQRGVALYKSGQFEEALKLFNTVATAEGIYNRANCQIMLGKYDAAIELYQRAIEKRPDWTVAIENRDLAIARKTLMAPPDDDAGGTDGKLAANELVFDDRAKNSKNQQVLEAGAGDQLSDQEMRALWLRKVQTQPADFLRNKFAYQLQFGEAQSEVKKKK
ncbi:MAG: tetratricopeptide repeat protein [Verrucomicrobiales bacterium]|nr:tetratricopeptide repeat protein [Verrucomicrobiales bacterium]